MSTTHIVVAVVLACVAFAVGLSALCVALVALTAVNAL